MNRFRKLLPVLLVLVAVFMLTGGPVFAAGARHGLKTYMVETHTALALPAGTWVWGIGIYSDDGSSWMATYDIATLGAATDSVDGPRKDEIGEATQYDTQTRMYALPIQYGNGVTVRVSAGVGTIYYGPAPN